VALGQSSEGNQFGDSEEAEMVFIEGGEFLMGCRKEQDEDCEGDEKPAHKVSVNDFYMGKYEVTFEEYDAFCEATGRDTVCTWVEERGERPVIYVDWYDAIRYCNWLSKQEGLKRCYKIDEKMLEEGEFYDMNWSVECDFTRNGYRLPTEAEWEYAAVGGKKSKGYKWAGTSREEELSLYGNYRGDKDGYEYAAPVGSFRPNELGLYDMSGNVWEWCWDQYEWYAPERDIEEVGSIYGPFRVLRGGSWFDLPVSIRVTNRSRTSPFDRENDLGFRLVRNP